MSDGKLTITFDCKICGGKILELPDNPDDDSIASCKNCGQQFGRFGDIKAMAKEKAKEHLQGELKSIFKKAGWKTS